MAVAAPQTLAGPSIETLEAMLDVLDDLVHIILGLDRCSMHRIVPRMRIEHPHRRPLGVPVHQYIDRRRAGPRLQRPVIIAAQRTVRLAERAYERLVNQLVQCRSCRQTR